LFGYDPIQYQIGRGALEATGIGFELEAGDVAVRGNFCTLDAQGRITDRRAGRIASEESAALVNRLQSISIPNVRVFVEPVKEHRFVAIFRGLSAANVNDTDPQATGVPPLAPEPRDEASRSTALVAAEFIAQARRILEGQPKANGLTLRGFAARPQLPSYAEVYGLKAVAIAVYPMYKGLARLVGMHVLPGATNLEQQTQMLAQVWGDFDFFFLHFKYTDSTGEDGDFDAKVRRIEELDLAVANIAKLNPTVLIVTGDHSTPSYLKSHSWHPVPTLLVSDCCRPDRRTTFSEHEAFQGGLGIFPAKFLMPLALANAGRLGKFGA
jgi:2,3-bisphosphoglycerate-independent phosphoglycerate mutase